MRINNFDGGTIIYPDTICFAFNVILVRVITKKEVTFTIGNSYTDKRPSFGGVCEIDISQYVQTMFSAKDMIDTVNIAVIAATDSDNFTFTTDVIFGSMNVGEVFNASRVVTWFWKFPFTMSMYIAEGSVCKTRYDKNQYQTIQLKPGLNHVTPAELFSPRDFGVIRIEDGAKPKSTFEYTFDNTFAPVGDGTVINRLVMNDSDCGVYLRWIDRHGFYQYYLFAEGEEVEKSANEGERIFAPWNDSNIYYDGVGRHIRKRIERTKKLCAVMVDRQTYNMIKSVCTSPRVDMFLDWEKWLPVTVSDISVTSPSQDISDLEIEINLPDIQTQRL